MSILKIIKYGEPILRAETKEVYKISAKIQKLIKDMINTMYAGNGVGLAAPQVGENYKIFVIDISQSNEANPIVFINPKIVKKSGAVNSYEGCLSFPDVYTDVRRYSDIIVKAKDKNGKDFVIEAKNGELLARAIQHEMDHLSGILFIDHATDISDTNNKLNKKGLPSIDKSYLIQEDNLEKAVN
jgi:peptide deformylase